MKISKIKFILLMALILLLAGCSSTPKHYSVASGDIDFIKKNYKPSSFRDPYAEVGFFNMNPLITALKQGNEEVVFYMLDNNHPLSEPTHIESFGIKTFAPGSNVAEWACRYGNFELGEKLSERYQLKIDPTKCLHLFGAIFLERSSWPRDKETGFSDLLSISKEEGLTFIKERQLVNRRMAMGKSISNFTGEYSRKHDVFIYWSDLSIPFLKSDNKTEYIISGIRNLIDQGASLDGYVYQPKYIDGTNTFRFPLATVHSTPALHQQLLDLGLDPNKPYQCNSYVTCSTIFEIAMLNGGLVRYSGIAALDRPKVLTKSHVDSLMDLLVKNGLNVNGMHSHTVRTGVKEVTTTGGGYSTETHELTYLQLAAYYGAKDLFEALLRHGADPKILSSAGIATVNYAGLEQRVEQQMQSGTEKARLADRQSKDNSDFWNKAIAVGLGAAAIGSMDIPTDLAGEAIGSLATDIITDSGGTHVNAMHDKYSQQQKEHMTEQQTDFQSVINRQSSQDKQSSLSPHQPEKQYQVTSTKVDCGYEYYKAETALRNSGHFKFASCDPQGNRDECQWRRESSKVGAVNSELVARNFSQCQVSLPKRPARQATNTSGSGTLMNK